MSQLFSTSSNREKHIRKGVLCQRRAAAGFSVVELLVSVSVLTIITAIVLTNHARFSGDILLGNLAYDIALSIRQAQVYGVSVREFGVGSGEFGQGYGVHFDTTSNNNYTLFADENNNDVYDGGVELLESFTVQRGNIISSFCARLPGGTQKCSPSEITYLDILFNRPDPEAKIKTNIGADVYETASITIESPHGTQRTIFVASTGQISIEQEAQATQ